MRVCLTVLDEYDTYVIRIDTDGSRIGCKEIASIESENKVHMESESRLGIIESVHEQ